MEYTFSAIYEDGKKVTLSPETGYESLVRDNLKFFEVQKDNEPFLLMKLDKGAKLIYRKRVERMVGKDPFIVYLLGWKKGDFQSMNYISQDGRIVQGGDFDNNDSWMYAPTLREYEV